MAWSSNGKYLAVSDWGVVQVWDPTNGTVLSTYGPNSSVESLAWSPDSKRLVSVGTSTFSQSTSVVQVWNALDTNRNSLDYTGHAGTVHSAAWSPDGKYIATGGADRTVQVWDATTGNPIYTFRGHKDAVMAVAWSPDGTQIASSSKDGTFQVWGALDGQTVMIFPPQA